MKTETKHINCDASTNSDVRVVHCVLFIIHTNKCTNIYIETDLFQITSLMHNFLFYNNIQGVPGGMNKTSGECSLC